MAGPLTSPATAWRPLELGPLLGVLKRAACRPVLRQAGLVVFHAALGAMAFQLAFLLRFDGVVPPHLAVDGLRFTPLLIGMQLTALAALGGFRGLWRFTSIGDVRDLVVGMCAGTAAFVLLLPWLPVTPSYPRSVLIIGTVFSIVFVAGAKVAWRAVVGHASHARGRRILVYGAGCAGEMIVRDLQRNGHTVVGLLDDDPSKLGHQIHHVPVLGGREDVPHVIATEVPDEVLVAMPSAGAPGVRQVVRALEPFRVPITTVPPLQALLDGKVSIEQVRRLVLDDLLTRPAVPLDLERARRLVEGRRVLVTGAGGSIGSELSRQIHALGPERLLLFERYENNLYAVLNQVTGPGTVALLGDVTDLRRLHAVMRAHRPHVVFHAAAHKHVPLMELNPCEAVKNNVIGTRRVAEAALQVGVEQFVLISTDKAVRPSSLMGATKRVAELIVASMPRQAATRWATVRFGNVLGSNGSVVPRWLEQIDGGGPVTITDPDVTRFFMSIGEAVHLILQAAARSQGHEMLILDMGAPVRLLDMARTLIRLNGRVPDEEIPIVVTGLRDGEKLHEELVNPEERLEGQAIDRIFRVATPPVIAPASLLSEVHRLSTLAAAGRTGEVLDVLCALVPSFVPGDALRAQAGCIRRPQRSGRAHTHASAPSVRRRPSLATASADVRMAARGR